MTLNCTEINLDSINPTSIYNFTAIIKAFRISRSTLDNDRKAGKLLVLPNKPTWVRGDWLLEYMKGKKPFYQ